MKGGEYFFMPSLPSCAPCDGAPIRLDSRHAGLLSVRRLKCRGRAVLLGLRRWLTQDPGSYSKDGHDLHSDLAGFTALGERLDPERCTRSWRATSRRCAAAIDPPRRPGREVHRRRDHGRLRRSPSCTRTTHFAPRACALEMREALTALNRELRVRLGRDAARAYGLSTGEVAFARGAAAVLRPRRRRQRRPAPRVRGTRRRGAHQRATTALPRTGRPPERSIRSTQGQVRAGPRLAPGDVRPRGHRAARASEACRTRRRRPASSGRSRAALADVRAERRCRLIVTLLGRRRGRQVAPGAHASSPRRRGSATTPSVAACRTARASPSGRSANRRAARPARPDEPDAARPSSATDEDGAMDRSRGCRSPSASRPARHPIEEIQLACAAVPRGRSPPSRPLVVVVEDIHWAEPTFLDLLEHVAHARPRRPAPARLPGAPRAARAALSSPDGRHRPASPRCPIGESERLLQQLDRAVASSRRARPAARAPPRATRSSSSSWWP